MLTPRDQLSVARVTSEECTSNISCHTENTFLCGDTVETWDVSDTYYKLFFEDLPVLYIKYGHMSRIGVMSPPRHVFGGILDMIVIPFVLRIEV